MKGKKEEGNKSYIEGVEFSLRRFFLLGFAELGLITVGLLKCFAGNLLWVGPSGKS